MRDLENVGLELRARFERAPALWDRGRPGKWTAGQHADHLAVGLRVTNDAFEAAEKRLREALFHRRRRAIRSSGCSSRSCSARDGCRAADGRRARSTRARVANPRRGALGLRARDRALPGDRRAAQSRSATACGFRTRSCRDGATRSTRSRAFTRCTSGITCGGSRSSSGADQPKRSDCGSQKSPSRPMRAKMARISSGPGRRESGSSRVRYQSSDSAQSCGMETSGRGGNPRDLAPLMDELFRPEEQHRASGVDDVVPPSRRRHRAVEAPVARRAGPSEAIISRSGASDIPQRDRTSAGRWSAAGMPRRVPGAVREVHPPVDLDLVPAWARPRTAAP